MAMISDDVVILTRAELEDRETRAFRRGVARGRFEESCDRSRNSEPPGKAGHSAGAIENHGNAEPGSAGGPPQFERSSHPWMV